MKKASNKFTEDTGYSFKAMGELEYYIISEKKDLYPSNDQRGYHEASPFTNWENLRTEALLTIAQCGGKIKYGHSEVGNFTTDTHMYEQNEIEFTPVDAEEAVEQLIISKWIIRMLGQKHGVTIANSKFNGGEVDSYGDHRIAMSFAVAAIGANNAIKIKDIENIDTSFPGFVNLMQGIGVAISIQEPNERQAL